MKSTFAILFTSLLVLGDIASSTADAATVVTSGYRHHHRHSHRIWIRGHHVWRHHHYYWIPGHYA